MTPAGSQSLGQRALQVSQVRQSQMDSSAAAARPLPPATSRMTSCGLSRISPPIGQPAEHLPHW